MDTAEHEKMKRSNKRKIQAPCFAVILNMNQCYFVISETPCGVKLRR